MLSSALCPCLSAGLWSKVVWVSRVEFLWEHMKPADVSLPSFVTEHDTVLEDQPLHDYGVVGMKEVAVMNMQAPI
ncbi:hypothetical protein FOA52_007228 [Chlamydomonas sp. UWO 241]|nr:hypothetical protein FOA52_007228 [Chlamydomonas sp. UWO 241]